MKAAFFTVLGAAFGLLFVLVALESVLNGFFFAKGSEFGLVGGIGTATFGAIILYQILAWNSAEQ